MSKTQVSTAVSDVVLAKLDAMEGPRSRNIEMLISSAIAAIEKRAEERKRKALSLRLEPELHDAVLDLAKARGQTIQQATISLIKTGILTEATATHASAIHEFGQQLTTQTAEHHHESQLQAKITQELLITLLHANGLPTESINELMRDAKKSALKALKKE